MSNKQYTITLTEKQLDLIGKAVEMMLRTGMGQMYNLAEWITLTGHDTPSCTEFDVYIAERCLIQTVLEGISRYVAAFPHGKGESGSLQELKTLYEAVRHQQRQDSKRPMWDVRANEPMKFGSEPVPEIERVDG